MDDIIIYDEEELIEKVQNGEFNALDYIKHHSEDLYSEYVVYCSDKNISMTPETADNFLEWRDEQFEKALEEGNA